MRWQFGSLLLASLAVAFADEGMPGQPRTRQPDDFRTALAKARAKAANNTFYLNLWVDKAGKVTRVEVPEPRPDSPHLDALVNSFQGRILPEPPPADLPMPIRLRIVVRPDGSIPGTAPVWGR